MNSIFLIFKYQLTHIISSYILCSDIRIT